jgi:hypothetical protein
MLMVSAGKEEALDDKSKIKLEWLALHIASHNPDHLLSKFKVCPFELEVICWRDVQDEPKVYMH